jgi:hypothetical protein
MWPKYRGLDEGVFGVVVAGVGLTGVFWLDSRYVGHVGIFEFALRPCSYHL